MSSKQQRFLFPAFLGLLFLAVTAASAANILPIPKEMGKDEVQIDAAQFSVDQKTGWVTARKEVKITTGDHELRADSVRLNRDTGDVQARGNVQIRQIGFGTWLGDYIEYNYKTGKGMTGISQLDAGLFHIHTEEVTRREDGRFDIQDIRVTTCTNAPGSWHWHVRGRGRYKDNDYVEVFNAVPYLFGVPFGWLPYWFRDLDRHYGFRLMPGYTSKWGAYLLGGYVFKIYEAPKDTGPKVSGSTHLDYRTRRGVGFGQNVRWDLKEFGVGRFESYYAWDDDPSDDWDDRNWMSQVDHDRYRFRLFHKADLTPRDRLLLRGTVNSDSEMGNDFFEKDNRGESIPMNFLSWDHHETSWAFGTSVSGPLNDFYSGSSHLPEGWLSIMPRQLPFTDSLPLLNGIRYESENRLGYYERQYAHYKGAIPDFEFYPGEWADYDTVRGDTAHRFTYPMKFRDILSVVPRVGYRGTYYSDTLSDEDVAFHSADLGLELSMRATSVWKENRRHILEPYLDYSFQPTDSTMEGGDRRYYFDHLDRSLGWQDLFGRDGTWLPYDWHGIRPGLRNLIQTRTAKGDVRTLFDLDTYAVAQFDSEGPYDDKGLSLLGTRMVYTPNDRLEIGSCGEWDVEEDAVAYFNFSSFYKVNEFFRLGGGYIGRDHDIHDYGDTPIRQWNRMRQNLAYGGFTHTINDQWSWSCFVRYDFRRDEVDEIGGYIQYQLDCLAFQLRSSYINDYKRIDGSERDDDFRVSFTMWIRNLQDPPGDEWQSW